MTADAASVSALLTMRGIRKSFAGGEVLHGVDLSLERGEVRALVGQNGAGKSTLMKVLGGVYPDYDGEVRIDGGTVRLEHPHDAIANGVAVIYQDFALVPELTVAENIGLGREPDGPRCPATVAHRALASAVRGRVPTLWHRRCPWTPGARRLVGGRAAADRDRQGTRARCPHPRHGRADGAPVRRGARPALRHHPHA